MKLKYALITVFFGSACAIHADTITFDFDNGSPTLSSLLNLPVDQTSGGLTAHFGFLPGGGFSLQSDGTTGWHLSQFTGLYVNPNSLSPGPLEIAFSQPVTDISFVFATADFNQAELATIIQLTAYMDSTGTSVVGSTTTRGSYGTDSMPMGTLSFSSGTPFSFVDIGIPQGQPQGTADFLVDNIAVTTTATAAVVPEPVTYLLSGIGLLMLGLLRHRSS
jgi:hypothetical protein